MAALGIGLLWISYSWGLYGYCLIRGYNVTPRELFSTSWPPGAPAASTPSTPAPTTPAPPSDKNPKVPVN